MAQALRDHFRLLTINVDYPDFPSLPEQQRAAVSLKQRYPGTGGVRRGILGAELRLAGLG